MKRTYLALFLSLFLLAACKPPAKGIHGYVEGEYVLIAPTTSGLLQSLSTERGQNVESGDPLFAMDSTDLIAARDSAQAEVARKEALWNDLTKGERPEETEILIKQKVQAEAELINARKEYNRVKPLVKTGAASQSSLDDSRAALDTATARVQELEAKLKTSALGGREDQLTAAKADIDIARQNLVQAEKRLREASPAAPEAAHVEDTFYRPGEYVPAGNPVVELLPPGNVKIRFFVAQETVPKLRIGNAVTITCDGCASAIPAKITFIASQAEYTPPVIYSVESRDKLVFMIEAKPDSTTPVLRPGLPVDVDPGAL